MRRRVTALLLVLVVVLGCMPSAYAVDIDPFPTPDVYVERYFDFKVDMGDMKDTVYAAVSMPEVLLHPEVFVFIHARARSDKDLHRGYDYVISDLNDLGYRVVSLNICDIYEKISIGEKYEITHVQAAVSSALSMLREGMVEGLYFGSVHTVSLVGHSRGGYLVLRVADDLMEQGYTVANILSLAPCIVDTTNLSIPDVDTTIIIPEQDGDVVDMDGAVLYSEAVGSERDTTVRSLFLLGANHNAFNTELKLDDRFYLTQYGRNIFSQEDLDELKQYALDVNVQREFFRNCVLKYMTDYEDSPVRVVVDDSGYTVGSSESEYVLKYPTVTLGDNFVYREYIGGSTWLNPAGLKWSFVDAEWVSREVNSVMPRRSLSYFREPGFYTGTYDFLSFDSHSGVGVCNIPDKAMDTCQFDLAIDWTTSGGPSTQLFVTAVYTDGTEFKYAFTPVYITGNLRTTYGGYIYNRFTPFASFSLDLDESKILDKLIFASNTDVSFAVGDFFYTAEEVLEEDTVVEPVDDGVTRSGI